MHLVEFLIISAKYMHTNFTPRINWCVPEQAPHKQCVKYMVYVTGFEKTLPSVWDQHAIRAMRVFSTSGQKLSKSPDFVISMSKNPSSVTISYGGYS